MKKVNPKAAQELITANSSDVLRNEGGAFLDAFGTTTKNEGDASGFIANMALSDKRSGVQSNDSIKDRLSTFLDKTGVTKGGFDSAMDKGKSIYNALVRMADDVSPFYQAYLKMKDKRDNTADELNAEIAKLAAERKKLKLIEAPLTAMDTTYAMYQKASPLEMEKDILSLLKTVHKYRGTFVLLWHNSSFSVPAYRSLANVYENIIQAGAEADFSNFKASS